MEDKDFMEMRKQIAILNDKLNEQTIVNDRLIRASMRDGQQEINRQGWRQAVIAILAIPLWLLIYQMGTCSLALALVTAGMMIFSIAATWYCHRPVNHANLYTDDVASVAKAFASVKRMYHIWITRFAPAMLLPWLAWIMYEYSHRLEIDEEHRWAIYAMVITGALIGFLIGYSWHRKVVRKCQDVIDQLQ